MTKRGAEASCKGCFCREKRGGNRCRCGVVAHAATNQSVFVSRRSVDQIPDSGEQGYQVFRIVKIQLVTNTQDEEQKTISALFRDTLIEGMRGAWRVLVRAGEGGMMIRKPVARSSRKLAGAGRRVVPSSALISNHDGDK